MIGISLNYLSQALTAFAMIVLSEEFPGAEGGPGRRAGDIVDEAARLERPLCRARGPLHRGPGGGPLA